MKLTKAQLEWTYKNTKSHEEHLMEEMQDEEYQRLWLEITLTEFLQDGDIDEFVRALTCVVKARGRGAISTLARELNMDRSNLSEIINGKTVPHLDTAFKLLKGLGYSFNVKLESKSA